VYIARALLISEKMEVEQKMQNWREKATMNLPEFTKRLGISKSLAYKMASNNQISVIRLGQKRIVLHICLLTGDNYRVVLNCYAVKDTHPKPLL